MPESDFPQLCPTCGTRNIILFPWCTIYDGSARHIYCEDEEVMRVYYYCMSKDDYFYINAPEAESMTE